MQTRLSSFFESCCNFTIGYAVGVGAMTFIFPFYGVDVPLTTNMGIALIFMSIGLARGYIIRRWFNAKVANQTKMNSFVEALSNTVIAFGIFICAQLIIFPLYDIHISFFANVEICLFFTIVSIIRAYCLRRLFNKREEGLKS